MIEVISSRDNKKYKLLKSLAAKKTRDKSGLFVVEGKRMTNDVIEFLQGNIEFVFMSCSFAEANGNLLKSIDNLGIAVYTIKDNLLKQASNTVTPQGIGAVVKAVNHSKGRPDDKFVLVLDGVSEPGNLGTIIRTAEAAGIDRVYMLKGCADIYNPKVVRSTMGSMFRIPFVCGCALCDVESLKCRGFDIVVSSLGSSENIYEYAKKSSAGKRAIVIGSEAFGVSDAVLELADVRVHIPMQGNVESLNAAVAAGILMYML